MSLPGMYGAVDLSALTAKPAPAAPAGEDGKVRGAYVIDLAPENINATLDLSNQLPIVVVFRSERAENSLTLDTKLQAAAREASGTFQVARVDVDAFPESVQAFRVTGVPAVVALMQGQPLPLFQGLPTDEELEQIMGQLMQAAQQYGLTAVLDGSDEALPEPELPEHHKAALAALAEGNFELAQEEFTKAMREDPGSQELRHGYAQAGLLRRVSALNDPSATLQATIGLPLTEVDAHIAAADVEVAGGRPDAAFARLIDVVAATSGDDRDTARTRLIELFDVVGPEPLVNQARAALANALF